MYSPTVSPIYLGYIPLASGRSSGGLTLLFNLAYLWSPQYDAVVAATQLRIVAISLDERATTFAEIRLLCIVVVVVAGAALAIVVLLFAAVVVVVLSNVAAVVVALTY